MRESHRLGALHVFTTCGRLNTCTLDLEPTWISVLISGVIINVVPVVAVVVSETRAKYTRTKPWAFKTSCSMAATHAAASACVSVRNEIFCCDENRHSVVALVTDLRTDSSKLRYSFSTSKCEKLNERREAITTTANRTLELRFGIFSSWFRV